MWAGFLAFLLLMRNVLVVKIEPECLFIHMCLARRQFMERGSLFRIHEHCFLYMLIVIFLIYSWKSTRLYDDITYLPQLLFPVIHSRAAKLHTTFMQAKRQKKSEKLSTSSMTSPLRRRLKSVRRTNGVRRHDQAVWEMGANRTTLFVKQHMQPMVILNSSGPKGGKPGCMLKLAQIVQSNAACRVGGTFLLDIIVKRSGDIVARWYFSSYQCVSWNFTRWNITIIMKNDLGIPQGKPRSFFYVLW